MYYKTFKIFLKDILFLYKKSNESFFSKCKMIFSQNVKLKIVLENIYIYSL